MMRRPARGAFSSAYVFPGGAVDEADADALTPDLAPGFAAHRDPRLAVPDARLEAALWAAALRELLEEVGVLCGETADGRSPAAAPEALAAARADLLAGATLAEALSRHALRARPQDLTYVANFITPKLEGARRFDTRFFAARAPADQQPDMHAGEAVEAGWRRPEEVLAEHGHDLRVLLPPTRILLCELRDRADSDEVIADLGARPVGAILFDVADVLGGRIPERLPESW